MMKQRVLTFDILNVIACFSVIMLHHSGIVHHYDGSREWLVALAVECLFYFAVPCFFMLTGANLMRYDERYDTSIFFKKRISKAVIPYLIWSLVWLGICLLKGDIDCAQITVVNVVDGLLNSSYQPVYWFFIPLFLIYLLLPLLVKAKDDIKLIRYLIILFFILASCLPFVSGVMGIRQNPFLSNAICGPLLYVLLGYYLSVNKLSQKRMGGVILLGVSCLLIRYIVTMYLTRETGQTDKMLFGYYLPTSIFPSICIYSLVVNFNSHISDTCVKIIEHLSSLSLGVYLLHKIVIAVELRALLPLNISESSYVWIVLMPFVTWVICLIIVNFAKNNKLLKYIFP